MFNSNIFVFVKKDNENVRNLMKCSLKLFTFKSMIKHKDEKSSCECFCIPISYNRDLCSIFV